MKYFIENYVNYKVVKMWLLGCKIFLVISIFMIYLKWKKNEIVKWVCCKLIKFCEVGFYCGWFWYDCYMIIFIKGISDFFNY